MSKTAMRAKNLPRTERLSKRVINAALRWHKARHASMGEPGFEGFLLQANRVGTAMDLDKAITSYIRALK